jgi:hypothetical protein
MTSKSTPDLLPLEVWHAVVCALLDVNTLNSMVLTLSSFYQIFNNSHTVITTQVLRNEIQLYVLQI